MASFHLRDILLGVASAATQIEGGDTNNSWYDWYCQGKIKDGSSPLRATDHVRLWPEDFDRMRDMGVRTYRMSVEWSRIEPEKGRFDDAALEQYRAMLQRLNDLGIRPLLTLHHFTNPLWFEQMGAFEHPDSTSLFLRYAATVVRALGDLVSDFITINEPNVYAVQGYLYGLWPPGRKSLAATLRVMARLAECHIRAYTLIHQVHKGMGRTDTQVGFAHHMRIFAPLNPKNPWHRICARGVSSLFQDLLAQAALGGRFRFPLPKPKAIQSGAYYDFLGINYYTRSSVRGFADHVRPGVPVNDLGWEIWPEGLVACARSLYKAFPAPVYITENGTCDTEDAFRCRYIYEHLAAIAASDLPVKRYYHWCFCDNFEWLEGESARFGLVHIDFATQQRTIKRSGRFYAALIGQNGCDDALYEAFVADQAYPTRARLDANRKAPGTERIC
jgi:beta-glucosidase